MAAYLTHLASLFAVFGLAALGLTLLIGNSGIVHLGYMGLMALGAYAVAILTTVHGWSFPAALALGVALAGAANVLLALLSRRLTGDALAVVLFGFNFAVWSLGFNLTDLTRGALGIPDIPRPELLREDTALAAACVVAFLTAAALVRRIGRSPFGLVLAARRDDELHARVLGKRTLRATLVAMALAGALAAAAGGLYALLIRFVDPNSFFLHQLVFLLSIVFVGGIGSVRGALAGALLMTLLPELVDALVTLPSAAVGAVRGMVFSALLLAVMLVRPKGLFGTVELPSSYAEHD